MNHRQAIEDALDALEIPAIKTDITEYAVAISKAVRILRAAAVVPLCPDCGDTDPECPLKQEEA